jgi:hypothetical protein
MAQRDRVLRDLLGSQPERLATEILVQHLHDGTVDLQDLQEGAMYDALRLVVAADELCTGAEIMRYLPSMRTGFLPCAKASSRR